jgi:hypothetical protein
MIGLDNYESSTKDTWRGWQWNRIVERLLGFRNLGPAGKRMLLRNKTVLYLVGPHDKDRSKALKHGFDNHNLIAVDIAQARVNLVRKAGGLAIKGSLHQILAHWPEDWPIDAVIADFCGGMTRSAGLLHSALVACKGARNGTVVSINLMRGRDAFSNELRSEIANSKSIYPPGTEHERDVDLLHRGRQWFISAIAKWQRYLGRDRCLDWYDQNGDMLAECENSYRSESGHVFDSFIFRWPVLVTYKRDKATAGEWLHDRVSHLASTPKHIAARIAALRAIRTMKQRATA